MKIRKAVIPVAGLGTRFLPATKTVPKEMLPIVDKPTLLYIVEEIVAAGITELILITGEGKPAIEQFFDKSTLVDAFLAKKNKTALLAETYKTLEGLKVTPVRQEQPLGLGHAVLCAQAAVDGEPFAVLLGDELMVADPGSQAPYGIHQLIRTFERTEKSTVSVMEVADSEVSKYGIVKVEPLEKDLWRIQDIVEKPALAAAPSRLALPGRYVFDNAIFAELQKTKPGVGGEIQLTDAMAVIAKSKGMLAQKINSRRFDAGDKLGFLIANVEIGLQHRDVGAAFASYLKNRFGGN